MVSVSKLCRIGLIIGCAGRVGDILFRQHIPVRFVAFDLRKLGRSFLNVFRELINLKLRQLPRLLRKVLVNHLHLLVLFLVLVLR